MNNPVLILYLEDNPRDVELVRDKLQQTPSLACELRVARDRAEYEAALAQTRFDLILSDYTLPDYDGLAALALAQAQQPDVPFILVSGMLGEEKAVDCLHRGATDYVLKQRLGRLVPATLRALAEAEERKERRAADEELKFKNAILSTQQETSLDGILVVDEHGGIISSNRQFADMWGIPADVVAAKSDEHALQSVRDKLANPEEFVSKVKHLCEARDEKTRDEVALKDGRTFDRYSAPMVGADGKYYGRVWYFRDLTERKQAEEELKQTLRWQQGISLIQKLLLVPAPLEDTLRFVTDSIVRIFGADFCRVWLIRPGDLCERGCVHAQAQEGQHICYYRDRCLHLLASSGHYTHIDGKAHHRIPFGAYKIGVIASGDTHKFLTNDVPNDPLVDDHEWARERGLVSFVGYQLRVPGEETLGVLALFAQHPILPAEDALLDGLSSSLAQVIQQGKTEARLHTSEKLCHSLSVNA